MTGAIKAVQEGASDAIKAQIKAAFAPKKKESGPTPLSQDQLRQVKRIARSQAKKYGMDPEMAGKMAEALIGALVLAK